MLARTSIRGARARGRRALLATAAATAVVAAVAVVPLAAAAPVAAAAHHVVRPGETLAGIAASYGTTVSAIVAANAIANPNRIIAGQVLDVPGRAGQTAATVHRVAAGETLFDIARQYGISTAALAAANDITNLDLLRIGQQLTIPAGGDTSSGDEDGDDGDGDDSGDDSDEGAATTHTVRAGETLASIAERYDVTARAIAEANGLANANVIRIGQQLTIPAPPAGDSGDGGGTSAYEATGGADGHTGVFGTHTVKWGDSIDDVADQYGVSVEDLAAANGLLPPYKLYAGANLYLSAPNRLPTNLAVCPVAGARFANDWRFPRPVGRLHAGNDMLAAAGTPVRAPVDGEVTYLTGPRGGLQFELWGDDDTRYIGTHLDESGATGQVEAGDVIGYVGTSGNEVAQPHLHFEVHPDDGAAMNPYPVLRAACR